MQLLSKDMVSLGYYNMAVCLSFVGQLRSWNCIGYTLTTSSKMSPIFLAECVESRGLGSLRRISDQNDIHGNKPLRCYICWNKPFPAYSIQYNITCTVDFAGAGFMQWYKQYCLEFAIWFPTCVRGSLLSSVQIKLKVSFLRLRGELELCYVFSWRGQTYLFSHL